jgi:hypothetical protein
MRPKRRFWKTQQRIGLVFSMCFERCEYSIFATNRCKMQRKGTTDILFRLPKSSCGAAVGNSPQKTLLCYLDALK